MSKVIKRKTIVGITQLARELGVTRQHVYLVAAGRRNSRRIEQRLRAEGITGSKQ